MSKAISLISLVVSIYTLMQWRKDAKLIARRRAITMANFNSLYGKHPITSPII